MQQKLAFILLAFVGWMPLSAQDISAIFAKPSNSFTFVGQIVLYDPFIHGASAADDFIVRTNDPKMPFVRITYMPMWGFDAPPAKPDEILDRKAFIGDGSLWSFDVFRPAKNSEESGGCISSQWQHEKRKDGTIGPSHVSRFILVTGTNANDIPSIETMPCYVLRLKSWSKMTSDVTAPKN
jgi:hypothetical protein